MNVKALLEKNNISVAEIARQCQVSRSFASLVVHGHKVSRPIAKHIESLLGFEPGSLFPYVLKPIIRGRKAREVGYDPFDFNNSSIASQTQSK